MSSEDAERTAPGLHSKQAIERLLKVSQQAHRDVCEMFEHAKDRGSNRIPLRNLIEQVLLRNGLPKDQAKKCVEGVFQGLRGSKDAKNIPRLQKQIELEEKFDHAADFVREHVAGRSKYVYSLIQGALAVENIDPAPAVNVNSVWDRAARGLDPKERVEIEQHLPTLEPRKIEN